jgi:hypothetical protein
MKNMEPSTVVVCASSGQPVAKTTTNLTAAYCPSLASSAGPAAYTTCIEACRHFFTACMVAGFWRHVPLCRDRHSEQLFVALRSLLLNLTVVNMWGYLRAKMRLLKPERDWNFTKKVYK